MWRLIFLSSSFIFLLSDSLAQSGVMDLTQHDFTRVGKLDLDGEWQFYWNQFIAPGDFAENDNQPSLRVPGSWDWFDQGYSIQGYATYRLEILLPANQQNLSLYFPVINSAADIFINGKLTQHHGRVGKNKDDHRGSLSSVMVSLPQGVEKIDLVIWVSNFSYFYGGITSSPVLGNSSTITQEINWKHGVDNIFSGSLIAMFIYHFMLFLLYHRGRAYLFLALICLIVAVRTIVMNGGSFLMPDMFPNVDMEWWKKIEFFGVYAAVIMFPLYIYTLFKQYSPVWPLYIFSGVSILLCASVLITPQPVYGLLLDVAHVGFIFSLIFAIVVTARAYRDRQRSARILLWGVILSSPFLLWEILSNSRIIHLDGYFLVELAVLVFLLFQAFLLARINSEAFKGLEALTINLESIVESRTAELVSANRVKEKLLSVISHDIKSPLNSLKGLLEIFNMGAIPEDEFKKYTGKVEDDLQRTTLLVENVLFWSAGQLKGASIIKENIQLAPLVKEYIHLYEHVAERKRISLYNQVDEGARVYSDKNIIGLVLRNLLSNAIKFTEEGGRIEFTSEVQKDKVVLIVRDNGIGMNKEVMVNIFQPDTHISKPGTQQEKGTGLGLALCKEYLEKTGGSIRVESKSGEGSIFYVSLPVSEADRLS